MIEEVRAKVAESLKDLDGVLALQRTPEGTAPYLFHEGDDLSHLVLEPYYPLASIISMLQKKTPEGRIGIVARGCDVRALVEMAKRDQVDPDRLYILGITCTSEEAEACHCSDPAPDPEGLSAVVVGVPVPGASPNPLVAEYDQMSLPERRAFWQEQFLKCIKCYGCRNICPECFCEACALEDPLWVERGVLAPPFPMFHLIKAMHMANRCVACRQCESACPAHIPLTILYDLMQRDVQDLLGYIPGKDITSAPPLSLTLNDAPILSDSMENGESQ